MNEEKDLLEQLFSRAPLSFHVQAALKLRDIELPLPAETYRPVLYGFLVFFHILIYYLFCEHYTIVTQVSLCNTH